ncbi:BMP family lipoprotein [Carbonactinospora thermoautotrophica]|uniref:BMP family lipoprotein n=1 Tax=Carbonactinospora thermoautotrophica TaxID=1469144 RepID=UPI0023EF206A
MRRVMMMAAVFTAGALVLAGCGSDEGAGGGAAGGEKIKVGLAFDVGGRGDKSFNDSAAAGIEKAKKELGVEAIELSPKEDGSDRQDLLRKLAEQGYNPVIGVGFLYTQDVEKVAQEYPEVTFACVDCGAKGSNVANLVFAEEQGSFLVGAAAALKTKTNHIGFIGGEEGALIRKFQAGYEQGAKAVKPDIKIDVKYLAPEGSSGAGFRSPDKAKLAAQAMYQSGADIVYHAAGQSGGGLFQAAKEAGKLAIGVDADQALTDPQYADVILTSMLKRVDVAVFEFIKAVKEGKKPTGFQKYDLKLDGVGYSTTGGKIDDVEAKLDEYKQKIVSGQIQVADQPTS